MRYATIGLGLIGCVLLMACQKIAPDPQSTKTLESGFETPDYEKAARLNVELGTFYLKQGQIARAKAKFVHALKLAPKLGEVHSGMAYYLEHVKEFSEAQKEYNKAIRLSKQKGAVFNNYGAFLCRQNRFNEADEAFQAALRDKSYAYTAEIYSNAGMCAQQDGKMAAARHYLESAVQHDPELSAAWLELGYLESPHDLSRARLYLQNFERLHEPTARSLQLCVKLYADHQGPQASRCAKRLKSHFPQSPEAQALILQGGA